MRVLAVQMNPTVGDLEGNTSKILAGLEEARNQNADVVLFPELALSGYPPEDLLLLPLFTEAIQDQLELIVAASEDLCVLVGLPRYTPTGSEKGLYNSAAIICNGKLMGYQDKSLLPTYDVFNERRYFEPGTHTQIWEHNGLRIGVTVCEDIWHHSESVKETYYRCDPIAELKKMNPDVILNLSASPFSKGKINLRHEAVASVAKSLSCPVIYCNQVGGNDSLIFDGHSIYFGADGQLLDIAKGFEEDTLLVDLNEKMSPISYKENETEELYRALVLGLRDYFHKQSFTRACLGLSGGIDSAVVAAIAADALGKENVLGVMMPSRYSTESSKVDANELIQNLGIQGMMIPIEEPFKSFLDLLEPHFEGKSVDTTEENIQARIRGIILMALSNKHGYIVLGTGNKSESAMGYATLYGDMVGGLGVISDVTKREVYALAKWKNRDQEVIPENTLIKAPSAELRPNQKDSDSLPNYDIIDNVVEDYVVKHHSPGQISEEYGYPLDLVVDLVTRIHRNEYKRFQAAPGLRVSHKAFSVGRSFPIVERWV